MCYYEILTYLLSILVGSHQIDKELYALPLIIKVIFRSVGKF